MGRGNDAAMTAWTMLATRVLASNPGPMTLDGTNTYVVRRPDHHKIAVVDPGPLDAIHLRRIAALGSVEVILLTHHHSDHAESAARLSAMTGAPVRAFDETLCVRGAPLVDGVEFFAGGTRMRVVATPGHTRDSISIYLPEDRDLATHTRQGSMLTGDTILGRGSTVIAEPDGSLRDYLATLERLTEFGSTLVLPGHGPLLIDLVAASRSYLVRRHDRLRDVIVAVESLRASQIEVTVAAVADVVYAHVAPDVRFAAEASVKAQLDYLAESAENVNERLNLANTSTLKGPDDVEGSAIS